MTPALEDLRGTKVLVTGHTGFKGAWLVALLEAVGAEVAGFALEPPTVPSLFTEAGLASACVRHVIGDIRDHQALAGEVAAYAPELILHLAAQPLVLDGYASPRETFEANTMGTVNVLEAARTTPGVRAVVVVTTDKVYEAQDARPHREGDPLGGHDPYSASKAAAELVTSAFARSYFAEAGPVIASVRAGNVIGGGDWARHRLLVDAARALEKDRPLVIRNPTAVRPWQHVLDALSGYLLVAVRALAGNRSVGRAWNFGPLPGDHLSVGELLRRFADAYGRKLAVEVRAEPYVENPLLALDSSEARKLLGWRPVHDIDSAVAATAAWYRGRADGMSSTDLVAGEIADYLRLAIPLR